MSHCDECVVCKECGRDAFCLAEVVPAPWPCPHWEPICADCWPNGCATCERNVELAERVPDGLPDELQALGTVTLKQTLAAAREYLRQRREETGFDPVTNSHRREATP